MAPKTREFLLLAVIIEGGIFVLALGLGRLIGQPLLDQTGDVWIGLLLGILATVPMILAMWWCSQSQLAPLRALMREIEESLVPLFAGSTPLTLLVISVLAGIGEECLFRGIIQTGLSEWSGPLIAVAVSSTVFGLAHFISPTYAVLAGLIGAYLGGILLLTGNLIVPCVAHSLYDFLALLYLVRRPRPPTAHHPSEYAAD